MLNIGNIFKVNIKNKNKNAVLERFKRMKQEFSEIMKEMKGFYFFQMKKRKAN